MTAKKRPTYEQALGLQAGQRAAANRARQARFAAEAERQRQRELEAQRVEPTVVLEEHELMGLNCTRGYSVKTGKCLSCGRQVAMPRPS